MQAAKDTFLKTLAGRLALLNPGRTVVVDGVARPAVLAVENEAATVQLPHSTKGTLSGPPGRGTLVNFYHFL